MSDTAGARTKLGVAPYLQTFAGALGISAAPILVSLSGGSPSEIAFWRFVYALPFLFALTVLNPRARSSFRNPGWIGLALLSGIFFTGDLRLWHEAIHWIGAGPATVVANTQVVWIALYGMTFLNERPSKVFWAALFPIAFGMALLSGWMNGSDVAVTGLRGVILAMLAGVCYAGKLVSMRAAQRRTMVEPAALLFVVVATSLATTYAFGISESALELSLRVEQHVYFAALGIGVQVICWMMITKNLKRLPGHHSAMILLAQPTLSLFGGWWILGETLDWNRSFGAFLILAGIATTLLLETTQPFSSASNVRSSEKDRQP